RQRVSLVKRNRILEFTDFLAIRVIPQLLVGDLDGVRRVEGSRSLYGHRDIAHMPDTEGVLKPCLLESRGESVQTCHGLPHHTKWGNQVVHLIQSSPQLQAVSRGYQPASVSFQVLHEPVLLQEGYRVLKGGRIRSSVFEGDVVL